MPPDPPGVTVRPATATDQPIIRAMVRAAHLDPTALRWPQFVVAERAGEVVGIGQVRPYRAGRELGSLVVRDDLRGQGIGGLIVRALLAREAGDVWLECRSDLTPYYERFGFGEVPWQRAPMPLRLKAGMGSLLGPLFGVRLAVMVRRAQIAPGAGQDAQWWTL